MTTDKSRVATSATPPPGGVGGTEEECQTSVYGVGGYDIAENDRRRTVLVADDEPIVLEVIRDILEDEGFDVLSVADGHGCVEMYRANAKQIDLVILDLMMPGLSGLEIFNGLLQVRSDVKVLLTSGYLEREAMDHFPGETPAGFAQKPCPPAFLVSKVRELTE